jgi:hypothetical protein
VRGRKRPTGGKKCNSNETCKNQVDGFSIGNPQALLEFADLSNETVADQSAARLLMNMRSMQTVTTSGGVTIVTPGDDDVSSYGGVTSFGMWATVAMLAVLAPFL